jgi:hypothetical protein
MSNEVRTTTPQPLMTLDPNVISSLVINGDLKRLDPGQKVAFYNYRCQQAGLDPAAKPFDLLTLNGKEILYANAACTQQLTANRKLSHQVTNRELVDGIYCVFVRVTGEDGRSTENMGAVPVDNLKGEAKANAMLKATTKAIRRAVLAHCGLGMLDETEAETIPGAQAKTWEPTTVDPQEPPEWTDEEKAAAKVMIEVLGQTLMDAGLTEEAIAVILDPKKSRQMSSLHDPEVPYEKWANRWVTWSSDQIKKHVPPAVVNA